MQVLKVQKEMIIMSREDFLTKYSKLIRHFSKFKNRQNIAAKTFGYAPMEERSF